MTKDEMIRVGLEAKRLLENDAVGLVLERMRQDYIGAWINTTHENAVQREQAWARVKVLEDFAAHLTILAEDAQFSLDEIDKRK